MKHWIVDYSVRFMDGHTEEYRTDFLVDTIRNALDMAEKMTAELKDKDDSIEQIVIWAIGIQEMDVF